VQGLVRRIVVLRPRLHVGPHRIGWLTGAAHSSVYEVLRWATGGPTDSTDERVSAHEGFLTY